MMASVTEVVTTYSLRYDSQMAEKPVNQLRNVSESEGVAP